jgi:hypothetical protein
VFLAMVVEMPSCRWPQPVYKLRRYTPAKLVYLPVDISYMVRAGCDLSHQMRLAVTISALGIALDVAFVVKLDVTFFGSAATINNRVAFLPPVANVGRPFTMGGGGKYRTIDG